MGAGTLLPGTTPEQTDAYEAARCSGAFCRRSSLTPSAPSNSPVPTAKPPSPPPVLGSTSGVLDGVTVVAVGPMVVLVLLVVVVVASVVVVVASVVVVVSGPESVVTSQCDWARTMSPSVPVSWLSMITWTALTVIAEFPPSRARICSLKITVMPSGRTNVVFVGGW